MNPNPYSLSLAKQVLLTLCGKVGGRLAKGSTIRDSTGVCRRLTGGISQPALLTPGGVPVYDRKNVRHRHRELGRYLAATKDATQNEQFLSVCGPDGSKIGTSLSLTVAAVMAGSTGVVALWPPQVFVFCSSFGLLYLHVHA